MFFVFCHGDATIKDPAARREFCDWTLLTIEQIVDMFIEKFRRLYAQRATDTMARVEGFLDYYLGTILEDTAGVTGLELIRRTDGLANVKDITTIEDSEKRVRAERIVVTFAKNCIMNRSQFRSGQDYRQAIAVAVEKFS